mmetsp:Transcript_21794/g.45680  ORF Transcript_21794/g.45680 Transcript_21794/m.45680 type:complete len:311 (+) Transcript_21794:83-1015(+)
MKKLLALMPILALALTTPPSAFAFYSRHRLESYTSRNELSTTSLRKAKEGYSSMPPLSNSTSSSRGGNIFKVLKRDMYPTVDLPFENNNYTMIDHYFMGMALQQAQHAWDKEEVPIGAIVVREYNEEDDDYSTSTTGNTTQPSQTKRTYQILSAAHNRVETNIDASAHAELLAMRRGAQNLQNWRFPPDSRLYTTLEPCPMCLASIQAFRIDHIVYGAPDNRLGAIKTHMDLMSVSKHPYHEVKSVTGGVREKECGDIMVQFFRERRRKKKEMKGGKHELLKLPLKKSIGDTRKKRSRFVTFVKALLRRE